MPYPACALDEMTNQDVPPGTDQPIPADGRRADLIATRLRLNAGSEEPLPDSRLPWFALEHAIAGDLGHIHAAHDLRTLPIIAPPGLKRPLVVRCRRIARRLIHPLPEAQSVWNGANARVIRFLLRQLEAQAQAIETLERQVAELDERLRR